MTFEHVGTQQFVILIIGTVIFLVVPFVIAIIWKIKKKERFTTILTGAVCFLLFAIILEKPIQTSIIAPDHALSRFINARPVLWAFIVGLFPGVFEETGRLVAFKTVLKNRKNRETGISYGIGHGGFEIVFVLGMMYITYIMYAVMINSGTFGTVVDQVKASGPDQIDQVYLVAKTLADYSLADLAVSIAERILAMMFHIGASILVFYSVRDRSRRWLYPLAIIAHTVMDGIVGLNMKKVISLSTWGLEAVIGIGSVIIFFGAYFLLYRKDKSISEQ